MTVEEKFIAMDSSNADLFTETQTLRRKLQAALDENEELRIKLIKLEAQITSLKYNDTKKGNV